MGKEIERKYLVEKEKWEKVEKPKGVHYRQGYILNDPSKTVRIRLSDKGGFITIKGATKGRSRAEYEYEIPLKDAKELLDHFCEAELDKIRYRIKHKNHLWEVDEFLDDNEGLIIAEIELKNENEIFEIPEWINGEVTGEEKYYNANLVQNPYKNWRPQPPEISSSKVPWKILNDIADNMEAGMNCFIHKNTYEVISIPDENQFAGIDLEDEEAGWKEEIDKVDNDPDFIGIERMDSSENFRVMADFVDSLSDSSTKIRLITALEGHKPFGNFKHQIENAGHERELWFTFRRARGIEWVKEQLEREIH